MVAEARLIGERSFAGHRFGFRAASLGVVSDGVINGHADLPGIGFLRNGTRQSNWSRT